MHKDANYAISQHYPDSETETESRREKYKCLTLYAKEIGREESAFCVGQSINPG